MDEPQHMYCSNRTFMELKSIYQRRKAYFARRSNRTFMELKFANR